MKCSQKIIKFNHINFESFEPKLSRFVKGALVSIVLLPFLFVFGCNTIEHRSDAVKKKPLPTLAAAKLQPKLAWSTHHGIGSGKMDAKLQLAVAGNVLITADVKGEIRAQDRKTGVALWRVPTKTPITSGPTIINDLILVGTQNGHVLAHDLKDGHIIWDAPVSGEVLAAPQSGKGMIFVHALDGSVTALNLRDGHTVWRYSLNTPSIVLRQSSSPVVTRDKVIVGFSNGRLLSLNQSDGSVDWDREIGHPKGRSDIQRMADLSADPVIVEDKIYAVSFQGRLAALTLEGIPVWDRELSSFSGLAVANNLILISDAQGHILALDRNQGRTIWSQSELEGRHLTKPLVYGDTLVVGDEDGYLHWLSLKDGALLARQRMDSFGIDASPKVKGNTLYVLGRSGKIGAYILGGPDTSVPELKE